MGLFKSLKGEHPDSIGGSAEEKKREAQQYGQGIFAPPPEAPPSHRWHQPPHPFQPALNQSEYASPPGSPPFHPQDADQSVVYHDWTAIPDTALLPPPPALGHQASPSSNAKVSDADRAHNWCKQYSLIKPHLPSSSDTKSISNGDVRLVKPQDYNGYLLMPNTGVWTGSTRTGSTDACLLTSLPLYFASVDSPLQTGNGKTIYFEVKLESLGRGRGNDETSLALGYCAVPYPTWRMPGWERGSLAVHSDDGRRYVNDTFGGKDFTAPIKAGETIGIGMSFSIPETPPEYGASLTEPSISRAEVFFTRNGRTDGTWDLHEELDKDNEFGVLGLDGQFDLYGAVGVFGGIEFEVRFNSRDWLWQPS
ncbi:hypothetical protein MMC06_000680 [Schaereria dolodes]|nr:hypothetical protein [Schaereria dolodes]